MTLRANVAAVSGPLPDGHPARPAEADRRAADQPRHAGRHRLLVDAPLSRGVSVRSPRHRSSAGALVGHSQRRDPHDAARPQGQGLRYDLEPRAQRKPAQEHDPFASRKAFRRTQRGFERALERPHRGRMGHAVRQSFDQVGLGAAVGAGVRSRPAGAALSAIRGRHHGDGLRQDLRGLDDDALAADLAGRTSLRGRCRLYRSGCRLDPGRPSPSFPSSPK